MRPLGNSKSMTNLSAVMSYLLCIVLCVSVVMNFHFKLIFSQSKIKIWVYFLFSMYCVSLFVWLLFSRHMKAIASIYIGCVCESLMNMFVLKWVNITCSTLLLDLLALTNVMFMLVYYSFCDFDMFGIYSYWFFFGFLCVWSE